jgi:hypothetical protein
MTVITHSMELAETDVQSVLERMNDALASLVQEDRYLLENDVNERSISHRLALYLQRDFPMHDVDCEFNRDHDDPKSLEIQSRDMTSDDTQAHTVFPDIILHTRGTNHNFMVIEMKKSTNPEGDRFDLHKLRAFKRQLGYEWAVFVKVKTGTPDPAIESIAFVT